MTGLGLLTATGSKAAARVLEIPLRLSSPSRTIPNEAPQAIIVLTGPADRNRSLTRAAHAADLHTRMRLPVMICGTGAYAMDYVLQKQYGVRAKWLDDKSEDTFENAKICAPILKTDGVQNILLVTDEYHMWRARTVFRWAAIGVIPAPSSQLSEEPLSISNLLPSIEGRERISNALHEIAGLVWYVVRRTTQP